MYDATSDAKLNAFESESSWRALLTKENTFLNVTFLDGDDLSNQPPLRRYRSEPDFTKVWRFLDEAEAPCIMNNQLPGKKATDDGLSRTETRATHKAPMRRKPRMLDGTRTAQNQSRFNSHSSARTREPDSDAESVGMISSQSSDGQENQSKVVACAAESGQPKQAQRTSDGNKLGDDSSNQANPKPRCQGKRVRPCKVKRERYRKLLSRLKEEVEERPEEFCVENVRMPHSLFFNDRLKGRFGAVLQAYQHKVISVRESQTKIEQ